MGGQFAYRLRIMAFSPSRRENSDRYLQLSGSKPGPRVAPPGRQGRPRLPDRGVSGTGVCASAAHKAFTTHGLDEDRLRADHPTIANGSYNFTDTRMLMLDAHRLCPGRHGEAVEQTGSTLPGSSPTAGASEMSIRGEGCQLPAACCPYRYRRQ